MVFYVLRCGFSSSPAAIEACLGHLLKRRAAGFLRSDKIAALFTKVGKVYDTASEICRKVQEQLQQQADLTRFVSLASSLLPPGSNLSFTASLFDCSRLTTDYLHLECN